MHAHEGERQREIQGGQDRIEGRDAHLGEHDASERLAEAAGAFLQGVCKRPEGFGGCTSYSAANTPIPNPMRKCATVRPTCAPACCRAPACARNQATSVSRSASTSFGSCSTTPAGSPVRQPSKISAIFCKSLGRLPASLRKKAIIPTTVSVRRSTTPTAKMTTAASLPCS